MAGRPESPLDPGEGPLQQLAYELRALRKQAGSPTYREMAERSSCGASTLSQAAAGERLPTLTTFLGYVRACGGDAAEWEPRWRQAARAATQEQRPSEQDTAPPYRGLSRFEPGDRDLFFGRNALLAQLVRKVGDHRLVGVVGASGSGKSSLLRAGLVPALQATDAPGGRSAAIRILTPGPRPASIPARLLEPAAGNGDTVVVIDQFEELFTLGADQTERTAFLDMLLTACAPDSRLRVVIAVRADFFGRCAEHPQLAETLQDATVLVAPMDAAALREAIVKPAAAAGLIVERSLTARIVDEAIGRPGSLPLMSHALLETWSRRRGRALTAEMYEAAGGIQGAIAATAEDVYSRLSGRQAAAARRILLRLITPGDGAPDTRRPADRTELDAASPEAGDVLERLVQARLLTLDGGTADLAHEALITAWPRYRRWIEEDRERLRLHRRLTEAAAAWDELGKDPGALYRGSRLAAARDAFAGAHHEALTALETAFLDASTSARDRETQTAARAARRLRALTATLSVLLVLTTAAGLLAWAQNRNSQRQWQAAEAARSRAVVAQQAALSRQLAARSDALGAADPDLASLLAVHAYVTSPSTEAAASLETAVARNLRARLAGSGTDAASMTFSPDGRFLLTGSFSGHVTLWDVIAARVHSVVSRAQRPVAAVAFSDGGRGVVAARWDGDLESYSPSGHPPRSARVGLLGEAAVLSTDGRLLFTGGQDDRLHVREVSTGRKRPGFFVGDAINALALSADGRSLAVGGQGAVTVWDVLSGKERRGFTVPAPVRSLALSRDGHTLAASADGGSVRVWKVPADRQECSVAADIRRTSSIALSPDGRTLAATDGGSAHLWDVPSCSRRTTLAGHKSSIDAVAFSPDGRTLATAGEDHTIRLWDVAPAPLSLSDPGGTTVVSPGGRTAAFVSARGHVQLRVLATGKTQALPLAMSPPVTSLALSADSRMLAASDADGTFVTDTRNGRTVTMPNGKTAQFLLFSPDRRTLLGTFSDGSMKLWDIPARNMRGTIPPSFGTSSCAAFSPDGHTLATCQDSSLVHLWDPATARLRRTLGTAQSGPPTPVQGIAYSHDGRTLATAAWDGEIRLWETAHYRMRILAGTSATQPVTYFAFAPDGHTLAAAVEGGTIQLLDPATGRSRATLTNSTSIKSSMAFSPDGTTLAVGGWDSIVSVWHVALPSPAQAIHAICRAVDRDLTAQEQSAYMPGQPARPVCPTSTDA
jgi:WD40 repeat protein